jgi:excisionase family DNA binding protein
MTDVAYLTLGEIAAELRCSLSTVRRAVRDGRLHAVEVGPRTQRVPGESFAEFLGKAAGGAGGDDSVPAIPVRSDQESTH